MSVKLTSRLVRIALDLTASSEQIVNDTGEAIAEGARSRARVDSGAMRDGIQWKPEGPGEGRVVARDWKSHLHEFGTVRRGAQPMLTPAAEAERPRFEQRLRRSIR